MERSALPTADPRLRRRAARRGQRRRGVDRGTDRARDLSDRDGLLAHRFVIARILIWLLIVLVAAFTYPGALIVSLATRVPPPPTASTGPTGAVSWLHVAHPPGSRPYIADEQGRMVLLHGAIPASLLEFGPGSGPIYPLDTAAYENAQCPANSRSSRYPPLCMADLSQMAALGFNSVRLPISWSLLEPERGRFSTAYVDRVAQIVDWARSLRMYVIVDMHQNAFSHFVGAGDSTVDLAYNSGAPDWATFTDGMPSPVSAGQRELNAAVLEATTNFWYDRDGIQDEYLAALAFVASRFRDDPVVAGYGVYNEPLFGWSVPPGFEDLLLFPFYRRAIDAITGVRDGIPCWSGFFMPAPCGYRDLGVGDRRHLMFLDTGLLREVTDFPTHLGLPLSLYPNVVLAIHAYTHIYTVDALTYHYDPSDVRFALQARGQAGDPTTVVYVPRSVKGQITSDGAVRVVVSDEPDGSRIAFSSPTGGAFVVAVSPAPLALTGCG